MVLPLSRRLDLEPLPPRRQFVGGHHPRADAAGLIEILAHAPLRGVALVFADRAFHAAGIAGDAVGGILKRQMLGALADDDDQFAFVVELDRFLRPQQRRAVRRQRRQHAEEDRLEFRDVVLLRAFLDVVEVIEAEADDLAGTAPPAARISGRRAGRRAEAGAFLARSASGLRSPLPRRSHSPRSAGALGSAACRSMTCRPRPRRDARRCWLRIRRFS